MFIQQDYAFRPPCGGGFLGPLGADDCWNLAVVGRNPFSETLARDIKGLLADGRASEVGNVMKDGIGVHFDIGRRCDDYELCGDWGAGGRQRVVVNFEAIASEEPPDPDTDFRRFMPRVRTFTGSPLDAVPGHGVRFRYLVVFPIGGKTGGELITAGINGHLTPTAHTARTVAHELGHSLGLDHWGHEIDGKLNCKPNYLSLMNYAINNEAFGFSHGLNVYPIDPGAAREVGSIPHRPLSLGETSTETNFKFPVVTASGSVDFNRSRIAPAIDDGLTGAVRAGVTHGNSECQAGIELRSDAMVTAPGSAIGVTPALVIWRGRIWTFWVGPDGRSIRYRSDIHTGANSAGACATGAGALGGGPCNDWLKSAERTVPIATTNPIAGLSAIEWNNELVLAYTTTTAAVRAALVRIAPSVDPADSTTLQFEPPSSPASAGPFTMDLRPDTEIELSYMYVDTAVFPEFGSNTLLSAFVVTAGGFHSWWWTTDPRGGPSAWRVRAIRTPPPTPFIPASFIRGRRVAGVTTWPNRNEGGPHRPDIGFACGVFGVTPGATAQQRDAPRFFCYNKATDFWTTQPMADVPTTAYLSGRRPSVAFHTLRAGALQAQGAAPLHNDPTAGQFWAALTVSDRDPLLVTNLESKVLLVASREVRESAPPLVTPLNLRRLDWLWDDEQNTVLRTGFVLRENLDVSALKGVGLWPLKEEAPPSGDPAVPNDTALGRALGIDGTSGFDRVKFFPLVDGTVRAVLRDTNDFDVMNRHICLVMHHYVSPTAETVCGPPTAEGY